MAPAPIICLGLSHRTTPIELREQLSCSLSDLTPVLKPSNGQASYIGTIGELAVISTCNRLEVYARVDSNVDEARDLLIESIAHAKGVEPVVFEDHTYFYVGKQAVKHLFAVAAGLDSLVLGEPQILGQVADAYMVAVEEKSIGPLLTLLFRSAIRVGKRARTETAIGFNPASISSVAVAKAQQIVGDLRRRQALVIGMGEMGKLAMKSLQSRGVERIAVANRTREVAEAFAEGCAANAYTMAELVKALAESDVVFSATAAPHVIMYPDMVKEAMTLRAGRDLVLIDVAVPRDIDPAVGKIPSVHLYDVDDLQGDLDEALTSRRQETPKVQKILAHEMVVFEEEMRQISIRPLIVDLRQKAEAIRQRELKRALRHLGDLDNQTLEQFQRFSRSLVNKLLHDPTIRLKEKASNGELDEFAEVTRQLFSLESTEEHIEHE